MKKVIFLLIFLATLTSNAQNLKALDEKNGFRELHFGDSISACPAMKAFDRTPDSLFVFYRKTGDNYLLAGAGVDIVYTFYKGEFATVLIQTLDSAGSRKVLKYLEEQYGKGRQDDPYIERYFWYGRDVVLSYYEDINTFEAKIFISSIRIKLKSEGRDKY